MIYTDRYSTVRRTVLILPMENGYLSVDVSPIMRKFYAAENAIH